MGQLRTQCVRVPIRREGFTHLTILYRILASVSSASAVHGPSVASCLTMMCLDNCSSNSFVFSCPTPQNHRRVQAKTCQLRSNGTDKAKICPCRTPSQSWHSHSQHRSTVQHPSFRTWLCPELRTHSCTHHLFVAPCSRSYVLFSRCSPIASHTSTEHDLVGAQPQTCCSVSTRSLSRFLAQPVWLG